MTYKLLGDLIIPIDNLPEDVSIGGVGGPKVVSGTGIPAVPETNGSLFMRTDGTDASDGLYTRQGGAWFALGGGGGGGSTLTVNNTTTNITIDDGYDLLSVNTLTTGITITLPASPTTGKVFRIKDSNGSASIYAITISGNGHNIDNSSTYIISIAYMSITLVYNGTKWIII